MDARVKQSTQQMQTIDKKEVIRDPSKGSSHSVRMQLAQ
jgi:hypothetical protein